MRHIILSLAVALTASIACGGSTTTSSGSGGSGAGSGSGASGPGGGGSPFCPATPPANGATCTPPPSSGFGPEAHCSWGDDPRPECRTTALCQSDNTWSVTPPDAVACADPPLPAACPAPPPAAGTVCNDPDLECWYTDGARCWCSPCMGGSEYPVCQPIDPPQWACASPASGCPSTIPQAGTACTTPGLSCGPDCELEVVCEGGVWVWRGGNCPICAAPDTPIATPRGERAIAELRAGDLVYSVHGSAIVAVPILRAASTPVARHRVVRTVLDTGAVLEMSPGHPTADGRIFADLAAGTALDARHVVTSTELVPYAHDRTYDILPDSDSGAYFAAGALVGSTLRASIAALAIARISDECVAF